MVETQGFRNYALFLALQKGTPRDAALPNKYAANKKLLDQYWGRIRSDVKAVSDQLRGVTQPVYLCPASVFAQMYLYAGMDESRFAGLLDNSPLKVGKRLYGTELLTYSPSVLSTIDQPHVVMRAGSFNAEIQQQIKEKINSRTVFL